MEKIKGSYDVIYSLGGACWPAIHLKRHGLRNFSGPLDWYLSPSLSDVNRLLKNKFKGFMELKNMHLMDKTNILYNEDVPQPSIKSYLVKDNYYNIVSVHDFPIIKNRRWDWDYSSYREKVDRRINRFLKDIATSKSILFIRLGANYDQAVELQSILSKMVKGHFIILILQSVNELTDVLEINWNIKDVYAFEVPNNIRQNVTWDFILKGITLN